MIEALDDQIAAGDIEGALVQLQDALDRCDGEQKPPDFVAGPSTPELWSRMVDLADMLME